jgi:5'(3')-deoxyribonucleotidase
MCRLVICVNCVSVFADLVAEEDTGGLSSFVGNAVILVICVITVSMCRLVICVNCVSVFADLVAEEETGGLSSFVGNAVMLGDPCAWHVDANPASFPPSSPWVESFGFYYNRCGWVLLQQVWMGSTTTGVDGCG